MKLSYSCPLGCFILPSNSPQRRTWKRAISPCQWFLWPGNYSCWVFRHQHRPEVMISLILFSSLGWVFRSWFTLWWDLAEADLPSGCFIIPICLGKSSSVLDMQCKPTPVPPCLVPKMLYCKGDQWANLILRHLPNSLFPPKVSKKNGCLQVKAEQFSSNPN